MSGGSAACLCGTCPSCTAGAAAPPPVADPVRYRHSALRRRMLEQVGSTELNGERPLARFATQDSTDPAVAFVDAFAGGLHILAWNARRLADDATIARTEDRDALADLTALLGYQPRPAVAASTVLAFTLDDFATSPGKATIPRGTQVASVPGQDEKPQTFETDAEIEARAEWNVLKPVLPDEHQRISKATETIVLDSPTTTARVGDLVFVFCTQQPAGGGKTKAAKEIGSQPDWMVRQPRSNRHHLPSADWLAAPSRWLVARVADVRRLADPPTVALDLADASELETEALLTAGDAIDTVIVAGQRAAAFGAVAPDPDLLPPEVAAKVSTSGEWNDFVMTKSGKQEGGTLDLDAVYADAMPGRAIRFAASTLDNLGVIAESRERSRADFALSAKCSRIQVAAIDLRDSGFAKKVRETAIYIETARERLLVTREDIPLPDAATPDRIAVAEVSALPPGRQVILEGRALSSGKPAVEIATVRETSSSGGKTILVFERALATRFRGLGLEILGNAVQASHGATPAAGAETLGSGVPATANPSFTLKGKPLAFVPARNARGYAPALEVRVSGRLYAEVPSLFGRPPSERAYTVRSERDGAGRVQFAGSLPGGAFNVTALYRLGGGTAGNLDAGRLTMMLTPVLGVARALNPVPADGGSDAESIDAMRHAAPQSIRTLERVVALEDYEAFARSYRGVGKAMASEIFNGMRRFVCLTIATTQLKPPVPGSTLVVELRDALLAAAPPGRLLIIAGFVDIVPTIGIALHVDTKALRRSDVEAAVRARLGAAFSRQVRPFAQALHRSAILAAVQSVEGVMAARITNFAVPGGPPEQDGRLFAPAPAFVGNQLAEAGLLAVDPAAITFSEMKA